MFPSPDRTFPLLAGLKRSCFLKNIVKNPNVVIGDYTYYDDKDDIYNFEKNILYHFDFLGDKLIIGKFCQIAEGIKFLMNGMFHMNNSFSTYPFIIFSKECADKYPEGIQFPFKGDTVIGNDVWIGHNVTFMPGVHVGDGAIIGTNSLVTKDVGSYEIWGGNPARLIRKRFSDKVIEVLLKLRWWDWPIGKIVENVDILVSDDVGKLKSLSDSSAVLS